MSPVSNVFVFCVVLDWIAVVLCLCLKCCLQLQNSTLCFIFSSGEDGKRSPNHSNATDGNQCYLHQLQKTAVSMFVPCVVFFLVSCARQLILSSGCKRPKRQLLSGAICVAAVCCAGRSCFHLPPPALSRATLSRSNGSQRSPSPGGLPWLNNIHQQTHNTSLSRSCRLNNST